MAARQLDADVLIAGGGPAGCAAAIGCATGGLRTILVDRDAEPRERPGEALHPGVEPLLGALGIDGLERVTGARHEGIWVGWGEEPHFEPFGSDAEGPWRGFQVDRRGLDRLLQARAREAGAEVRSSCKVGEPIVEGGAIVGAQTSTGSVRARIVVDATGGVVWLGRSLGLASSLHSPRLVIRYGYAQGSCPSRDAAPAIVADPSGWTWTARVGPSRYQWLRLDLDPERGGVPEELAGLAPVGSPRGADVSWRLSRAAGGPGWFMAGDAGATLDPSSSHGVLKALTSGGVAAHLALAVCRRGLAMKEAAATYQQWLREGFERDVARLAALYGRLGARGFG
jgi:flavin-dependent dehydrogenase